MIADGSWSFIESVSVRESGAKIYNFEVFDNHNYFVGDQGTLVHNTCDLDDLAKSDAKRGMAEWDAGNLSKHDNHCYNGIDPDISVHKNSLSSSGPHDLYVIKRSGTDEILHFGETGRGYKKRGNEWIRKIRNEYGIDSYVEYLKTVDGKASAKQAETKYIDSFERIYGRKPGFTNSSGDYIQIQRTRH